MSQYVISYRIAGYADIFKAGPYEADQVEAQRADIAAYEGVHDVYVLPAPRTTQAPHGDEQEKKGQGA